MRGLNSRCWPERLNGCQEVQDDFFQKARADFPVLSREVNGLPLAYLDSAASAQKPSQVIDAEASFHHGYAAVHRGIHTLSAQATEKMENVRKRASRCSLMPVRRKSWRRPAPRRDQSGTE
ncbi:aminotransferase class V-fold PLP-dependent enzyme [Escherichia coli]